MANISLLSRLVNGVQRQVDLSTNTLVVGALQLKGATSGTLTQNAASTTTPYSITWPAAVAAVTGYVLSSDTSGVLSWVSAAAGSALDGTFRIENTADNTKQIAFDASAITTGTTRTITMADANVNLADVNNAILKNGSRAFTANQPMGSNKLTGLSAGTTLGDSVRYEQAILVTGANAFTADQSHGGFKITNLADPVNPQDAATKNYTDNLAHGLSWKMVVRAASTASLNLASMPATVDGVTLVSGDRFLAKDQSTSSQNGIYVFNGAAAAATRATDANTALELTWATVEIGNDSATQAGYIFRESADITTIGTDPVTFVIISHGLDWSFNNGLAATGNVVNVVPGDSSLTATPGSLVVALNAASGLVTSSGIKINLNPTNPGLAITTNQLDVKYGAGIVASASGIAFNPDGVSIEISSNAARIKTTAYDQVTITGGGGSAAAVAQAPVVAWSEVAGQTFAANTTYAVRYGLTSNSETAGRIYAADISTGSFDLFWVVGFIQTTGSVSAGASVSVIQSGSLTLKSADTNFSGTDTGKAIFLQSGGINATITAPSTSGQAVAKLGIVLSTTSFRVHVSAPYVA